MTKNKKLLKFELRSNAVFSAMGGMLLMLNPEWVAGIFELEGVWIFQIIGIGLLLFAASVWFTSLEKRMTPSNVKLIIWQDWAWVAGTIIILALDLFKMSTAGQWIMIIVGLIVALFAFFQGYFLRRI